jgi:hypothetical protein
MKLIGRWYAVVALVLLGTFAGVASPAAAPTTTRYFEVQIHGAGQLNSADACTVYAPCSGDYLTGHDMSWGWIAYALVVAQQQGGHTTMHLIGPQPRVAAYFEETVSYSQSNDCTADFSTGHGNYLDRFMTTTLGFTDRDGVLSVNTGPPMNHHFSQCGPGTVSTHGRDGTPASWDGLRGPWTYTGVRGPTRGQVRSKRIFVDLAYNQGLGVEHTVGGWTHTSCCGSSLVIVFTQFPGGQRNVLRYERGFARRHPVTSHGFTQFDPLLPLSR